MISAPVFNEQEIARYQQIWFSPPEPPSLRDYLLQRLRSWGSTRYSFRDVPTEERFGQIMIEWIRSYPREHWSHNAVAMYGLEMPGHLSQLKMPILLLNPLADDIPEVTKRAADLLINKQSRYVELPGWTHGALDGRTKDITKMVRDFLDQKA